MAKAGKAKNGGKTPAKSRRKRTVSPLNGTDITAHQFKKGNPGGPGRPSTREIREQLQDCVTNGEGVAWWHARLKRNADNGDTAAIRTMLEYIASKPKQDVDVTSDDKPIGSVLIVPDNGKGRD